MRWWPSLCLIAELCLLAAALPASHKPVPFSHKQHVAAGLKCLFCHEKANSGERAGLPSTALCMSCHQDVKKESPAIRRLAEYHARKEPVPWSRVYQLPDFVFFSHARHARAKIACETCHGAVPLRDALGKEKDMSMRFCVDCHRAKGASTACQVCHELK